MALRTGFVYLILGLAIAITGCAAPSPTNTAPTAESFPAQPETVTSDSVGPYVADFEEVYRHNVILATAQADSVTEISVNCTPSAVDQRGSEYQVRVDCGFSWGYTDDGSTVSPTESRTKPPTGSAVASSNVPAQHSPNNPPLLQSTQHIS